MIVEDIYSHLKAKGTWVNWNTTCDRILFGDSHTDIQGIAVAWMPTFPNLQKALDSKCNLFITHEPLFGGIANKFGVFLGGSVSEVGKEIKSTLLLEEDDIWIKKMDWLTTHQIVVMRCHDVWDDFPHIGIHGAWAKWLGFTNPPLASEKFYEVHNVKGMNLEQLVHQILKNTKVLGQKSVQVIGNLQQKVTKLALGTGAITNYRIMHQMGADVLLLTDDGTRLWESAQWAEDIGIPLIIVNHATAEEPGIRLLADYLHTQFPSVPVIPINRGCLYQSIF
jgi:putative NIF3 family GTP cyclohydrolase 1 type 2